MDAILKAILDDTSTLENRRVEQVVAICGGGNLSDGSPCSLEFREFLTNVPSQILRKYSEECLDGTGGRNSNTGLILQDVVNEVGDRLGFSLEPGYYRGSPSRIGHDGLWLSDDFSFVIEVKTSDLSIKLDTIAAYRQQLISNSKIGKSNSSILIVLGRQETGDLEAQIRGSKHAWDIRMIGTESLFRLVDLKENLNDLRSIRQITELLKPIEYTRVDKLIDAVFFTSSDISMPETVELSDEEQLPVSTPTDLNVQSHPVTSERRTHSSPVNFYEKCAEKISRSLGIKLIKNGRVTYTSSDKSTNVVLLNSKVYGEQGDRGFWYGFRPNQAEFLDQKEKAYLALGCGSEDLIILIPYQEFKPWREELGVTKNERGDLAHHHVIIQEAGNDFLVRVGNDYKDVTKYVIRFEDSAQ